MAQKVTDFFYQVSPVETISFTISGQATPHVFLDSLTLPVASGTAFDITPRMLNGMGAVHSLNCILEFPGGPSTYQFVVVDQNGQIDQFPFPGPNNGNFSKVEITIEVV